MTGLLVLVSPAVTENAVANGDTRTIHLHHAHTHEAIDATYMVGGRYDPVVLEKLNWFLRDWRRDEPTHMDPKLFDTIWEVYREAGSQQPIEVMSAYRSPETNSMLRHATRGVAEHSQHILGKAMDQHYVDVPMSKIRELAMRLQRGGVGFYPTAGTPFVHMDVGGVRHWPRMSYDQLARLFPDGKTVHIPSNGQPLAGYETARAELEARGDSFDYPTAGEVKSKGFFAWLFGGGDEEGDSEAARDAAPAPRRAAPTRFAAADPAPVGSTVPDAVRDANSEDAGVHSFAMSGSTGADPAAADPSRRSAKGRTAVASLPAATDPQVALAAEMRRQEAQRAAAAQADAQRAAAAQAEAQRVAAAQAEAQRAAARAEAAAREAGQVAQSPALQATVPVASTPPQLPAAATPLPPRRPVEVASAGPKAPGPRPDPASDRAATPGPTRTAAAPLNRAGLPAAIVQGLGPVPARVLAFAPPAPAPAVPLPAARPQFVAARLDRSNFNSLTGAARTDRVPPRVGLGSSVGALRPAAQANAASLALDGAGAPRRGFGARATDLSTDRFSGAAVAPEARVDTATLRKRSLAPSADN